MMGLIGGAMTFGSVVGTLPAGLLGTQVRNSSTHDRLFCRFNDTLRLNA